MGKQTDQPLKEASTSTPRKENKARKSWAEEHGGLIFLIIVVSVIFFVILYESCMNGAGSQLEWSMGCEKQIFGCGEVCVTLGYTACVPRNGVS